MQQAIFIIFKTDKYSETKPQNQTTLYCLPQWFSRLLLRKKWVI